MISSPVCGTSTTVQSWNTRNNHTGRPINHPLGVLHHILILKNKTIIIESRKHELTVFYKNRTSHSRIVESDVAIHTVVTQTNPGIMHTRDREPNHHRHGLRYTSAHFFGADGQLQKLSYVNQLLYTEPSVCDILRSYRRKHLVPG